MSAVLSGDISALVDNSASTTRNDAPRYRSQASTVNLEQDKNHVEFQPEELRGKQMLQQGKFNMEWWDKQ